MMAPMPSSKGSSKTPTFLFSAADSDDSSPAPSSPPSTDAPKSQCSSLSEGESFEGFGENESPEGGGSVTERNSDSNDGNNNRGVELELAPHVNSTPSGEDDRSSISRHSWSRTSLRRTPTSNPDNLPNRRWGSMRHSGRRQLGSNALASHLYRSSSFNSSGRSSNCDTTEDMYSDVSLEDVQDLNHKSNMTTSEAASQPESLDLDYDMWQGQFEFVGTNSNNTQNNSVNNNRFKNGDIVNSSLKQTESLEDLNFNVNISQNFGKGPILIDDETFLSLHPNDFDETISGPNSNYFIENSLHLIDNNTTSPVNIDNGKIINKDTLNNKILNKSNNSNSFKIENLKNFKNKLISDFSEKSLNQQQLNEPAKMNGFNTEIRDNLNEQLELLQRQVTDLADTQNTVEDRTTRTKTEYAVLQARYHMLEEQYRESELRAEERLAEEQKRHRELLARVEREAALQNENCQIKIRTIELEANTLREEAQRLRLLCDKQANDLHATEEKLEAARDSIASLQLELDEARAREKKHMEEKKTAEDLMIELSKELERLRSETGPAMPTTSPETLRLEELHQELDELRQTNKNLEEQNEELQAVVLTRGVEEGRHLLNGTLNSLAQELEEMSQTQDSVDSATLASLNQLQQAFKDKEEENQRLKHYIDTILLNIVENYPQLLEVKSSPTPPPTCVENIKK